MDPESLSLGGDAAALRRGTLRSDTLLTFVENIPYAEDLPPEALQALRAALERRRCAFGEVIVRAGDEADAAYVIASGRARALRRAADGSPLPLGTLGPGDFFGEMALLEGGRRGATVRASTEVLLFRLSRERFAETIARFPPVRRVFELMATHRAAAAALRSGRLGALPPAVVGAVVRALVPRDVAARETVVREGEAPGPMYLVERGRFRVFAGSGGAARDLAFLRDGDIFGELSALTGAARTATVEAVTGGRLLVLPREEYETLLATRPDLVTALEARPASAADPEGAAPRLPLDFHEEILRAGVGPPPPPVPRPAPPPAPAPAHAPDESRAPAPRPRIRRFPLVWQIDEMDCGVACLAMIARHFGQRFRFSRLRDLAHTSAEGTSMRSLARAATALGLGARTFKASTRSLESIPRPAVIHYAGEHWVCLVDVEPGRVRIADPAAGDVWRPRAEVERLWSGFAIAFDPAPDFATAPDDPSTAALLLPHIRPEAGALAGAAALALLAGAATAALVFLASRLLAYGAPFAVPILVAAAVAIAARAAAGLGARVLLARALHRLDGRAFALVARRLLGLPLRYFLERRAPDLERRLEGVPFLRDLALSHGRSALLGAAGLVAALAGMTALHPLATAIFLLAAPAFHFLVHRPIARRVRPLLRANDERESDLAAARAEAVRGAEAAKAAAAEAAVAGALERRAASIARGALEADLAAQGARAAVQAIALLALAGGALLAVPELRVDDLAAWLGLGALAIAPLAALLAFADRLEQAGVFGRRLAEALERDPEERPDGLPVPSLSGAVDVAGLTLRYGGPEAPAALREIAFSLPPGATAAVVGRSGAGKTSLLRCLAGLVDPSAGAVLYDRIDVRRLRRGELRRLVGLALEDPFIFGGTVLENICLGDEPDLERATEAAKLAEAHDFIARLPLGYETRVGAGGRDLSRAERQRIALARAVYRKPAVLILDEAVSALDAEAERLLRANLARGLPGTTFIVATHRLETIRGADPILVLDGGRLVERGRHDELIERGGLYAHLARS